MNDFPLMTEIIFQTCFNYNYHQKPFKLVLIIIIIKNLYFVGFTESNTIVNPLFFNRSIRIEPNATAGVKQPPIGGLLSKMMLKAPSEIIAAVAS